MSSMRLLLLFCTADAQRGWRNGNWISGFRAPEDVKAQWAARPPMFGPAPLANRRPVTDAPGKLAKPRTPAPLGEPLWPFPAQRYDADVVTGLALNYREFSHRAFVGTLRRAGYTGDITIITEPRNRLQRGCEAYLRKSGVVAYGLVPDCSASSGGNIKHKTCKWREGQPPLPLAIIRHALYLAIAKTYSPTSMFYVADYRDTFFQADPFARVVERRGRRLEGLELLVVAEHWPFKSIGNCPFNGGWVRNCWGRAEWDRLRNQSVLCSGSYMGAQPAIVNFETRLLNEVDQNDCHHKGVPSDQGYLNYLFYTGNLPAETFVETRGDGVVNTVGSLDGSRPRHAGYLPPTHVNIGEYWKIRDAEGYVLEDDMITRSAAVHQWDRFGIEFHQFVSELGRDVRPRRRLSSAQKLCDGERLIVIGGFHHSFTSVLRAQLAKRLGVPLRGGRDERWPDDHAEEACSAEWTVFKKPTNSPRDVRRFEGLRRKFPAARMIFCTRDAPNQIWSIMKRTCYRSEPFATCLAIKRCMINEAERKWRRPSARDWTVDLADFAADPRSLLRAVFPAHLAHPSVREPRSAAGPPRGGSHNDLRRWQEAQPVYAYQDTTYERESGSLAPLLKSLSNCARVRALPRSLACLVKADNCSHQVRDGQPPPPRHRARVASMAWRSTRRFRTDVIRTRRRLSSAQKLCDGERLIVIGGLHHSFTSVLRAQLAKRLGVPLRGGRDERWPDDHVEEACSAEWTVFKKPTNTVRATRRFQGLRRKFPAARMILCGKQPVCRVHPTILH